MPIWQCAVQADTPQQLEVGIVDPAADMCKTTELVVPDKTIVATLHQHPKCLFTLIARGFEMLGRPLENDRWSH